MRAMNRKNMACNKEWGDIIESMAQIEEFIDDFCILIFGRDNIICKQYVFAMQNILRSSKMTLETIKDCCKCFCMADANTLLRKYRDDLFFCLYLIVYDANRKLKFLENHKRMECNIEKWCVNSLTNLNIGEVLKDIGASPDVKSAVKEYKLQESFKEIGDKLNDYVHGNGYDCYNKNICLCKRKEVSEQLNEVLYHEKYITVTFLFLLILCSPLFVMATDYVDFLENGQIPPENSQYWVAPFVKDFLKNNIALIDENCYRYLCNNSCMFL